MALSVTEKLNPPVENGEVNVPVTVSSPHGELNSLLPKADTS